jgi:small subunit ribosomal protein S10
MKKQRIRLTLRSYDHQLLDKAVKQIVLTVKRTGSQVVGPIPMPNRKKCFTVLRSPHVDKKSREQFELITHRRILDIVSTRDQMAETMEALMKVNISSGVDVDIK